MVLLSSLVKNLVLAQQDPRSLSDQVEQFLWSFRRAPKEAKDSLPNAVSDVLGDLAMELEYYVADPKARAEEEAYFGDEEALRAITSALNELQNLGVKLNP